jgi:succinate-acetate transporter protein
MADDHPNRLEQLEDWRNLPTSQDTLEKLSAGQFHIGNGNTLTSETSSANGKPGQIIQYIPVPITLKAQLGSPTALAIGAFSTTLTTTSFALMGFRGLGLTTAFVGNFLAVAGIGMVISANWELVLGNTYAYTVLSAFGFFYFGFGLIVTPWFGIAEAYGGADSPEYLNALGFFVLSKSRSLRGRYIMHG